MIRIYDPGIILPLKVKDYFVDVAKRYKVKHQFYISKETPMLQELTTNHWFYKQRLFTN